MARKPIATDPRVRDFADAARRYCTLIDSVAKLTKREFVEGCARLLPELQFRAVELLDVKLGPTARAPRLTPDELHARTQAFFRLYKRLDRKLGKDRIYRNKFDPYEDDEEYSHVLGCDLAEIYDDIKTGLVLFGKGNEKADRTAVRMWTTDFRIHWGRHCTGAIAPLHSLLVRYREDSW